MVDPTRPSDAGRVRNDDPQPQEQTPQKSGPSSFDEVLRQSRIPQSPQQQQSAQQGNSVLQREVASREAGTQEQRTRQQDKTETREERRSGEGESRHSEGPSDSRVDAKGQQKEREGGGGQGQGQPGDGRGGMTREASQAKLKESAKTASQNQTQGAFAAQLKKAELPNSLSAHHIQQIVNKVLQYFRVKKLATGETELDIGFNEAIFKGLRLRLVQKDGKVVLHILSGEGDVRRLFEKSRASIEKALTDKGVKLSQIVIGSE